MNSVLLYTVFMDFFSPCHSVLSYYMVCDVFTHTLLILLTLEISGVDEEVEVLNCGGLAKNLTASEWQSQGTDSSLLTSRP